MVNQAGKDLCSAVMGLFVPLLLSCAAPSNSACASPTLSTMAVQLITHLAKGTGRSTDTFKARSPRVVLSLFLSLIRLHVPELLLLAGAVFS